MIYFRMTVVWHTILYSVEAISNTYNIMTPIYLNCVLALHKNTILKDGIRQKIIFYFFISGFQAMSFNLLDIAHGVNGLTFAQGMCEKLLRIGKYFF